MGLWPWIHGWFWLAFHPPCKCEWYLTTGHMLGVVVVVISMYGCESFATSYHFSFSRLLFSLLFLFLINDTTPPPPPNPTSPCMPHDPSPSPLKPFSFTSFPKMFLLFSLQMKLPPCFHHWDHHKGKYEQWHSLTTVDVWRAPLWTPRKMMKTYLHE